MGEWNDIHPLNKKAVAQRLFLGARRLVYGEKVTASGPLYKEMRDPLKLWHAMGEPSSLSEEQKKLLKEAAKPFVEADRAAVQDGCAQVNITARENGVVYFEVKAVEDKSDRGYCYKRVIGK